MGYELESSLRGCERTAAQFVVLTSSSGRCYITLLLKKSPIWCNVATWGKPRRVQVAFICGVQSQDWPACSSIAQINQVDRLDRYTKILENMVTEPHNTSTLKKHTIVVAQLLFECKSQWSQSVPTMDSHGQGTKHDYDRMRAQLCDVLPAILVLQLLVGITSALTHLAQGNRPTHFLKLQ